MLRIATCVIAAALAAGASTAAAAPVQRSARLHAGRNVVRVTVPHRTGARPPLIRYAVAPAATRCSLRSADYHAVQRAPRQASIGTLRLVVRCPRAARVHLRFTRPIVRTKPVHNGPGRIRLRLDKPPGRVVPAIALETEPPTRACRLTHTRIRTGRRRFALDGRFRCRGLHRPTKGRVVVGGVMAAHGARTAAAARAHAPSARASVTCDVTTDQVIGTSLLRREKFCLAPTQSVVIPEFDRPCPTGTVYTRNGDQWPGFEYDLNRRDGWWTEEDVFGGAWWGLYNWSPDISREVTIEWVCQIGAPVAVEQPQLLGEAAPGFGYVCLPGTWTNVLPNTVAYQWQRQLSDGTRVAIPGATDDTYRVTGDDVHTRLVCELTVTNSAGPTRVTLVAPSPVVGGAPRNTVPPSITADEFNANKLTCHTGSWEEPGDFEPHYEWLRDGAVVPGETSSALRAPSSWANSLVACRVTVTNLVGTGIATSPAVKISEGGGIIL
ncbi:MAG: hypothetical protein R2736_22020 [Solirubrobacterales bacterium]